MVKQERVYFRLEEINVLNGLDDNAMGQVIFKNPMREDMRDVLKTIAWLATTWDITPTEKYQLFLHNLTT